MVPIHALFLGHGIHCTQSWREHYRADDPHYHLFEAAKARLKRQAATAPDGGGVEIELVDVSLTLPPKEGAQEDALAGHLERFDWAEGARCAHSFEAISAARSTTRFA